MARNVPRTRTLAACCILMLLLPGLWNVAVAKWQHTRNPVPGAFYAIDGRQMHINCSGHGSPTVVIEAGAGADSFGWQGIQTRLSPITHVCTYDRAGHGWSEPRSTPHDAEATARELHALLDAAGVQRPLVLSGHSAGGLFVREYAREFPAEVSGVVLIDSSSPQQIDEIPGWRASYESDKRELVKQIRWEKLRVWSGWERITGNCHNPPSPELAYLAQQYDAKMCRPEYVGGDDSEFPYFEEICRQAGRLKTFGNVPLLVISKDPNRKREGLTQSQIDEIPIWEKEQEELKALSPLSWRVIAKDSGHAVHHDRPEVIAKGIYQLIGYLRGGPAPPFGTTSVQ